LLLPAIVRQMRGIPVYNLAIGERRAIPEHSAADCPCPQHRRGIADLRDGDALETEQRRVRRRRNPERGVDWHVVASIWPGRDSAREVTHPSAYQRAAPQ